MINRILIPLWVEKDFLGELILRTWGKEIYDSTHFKLLTAIPEPSTILLANA
jgi:hypothetical protein